MATIEIAKTLYDFDTFYTTWLREDAATTYHAAAASSSSSSSSNEEKEEGQCVAPNNLRYGSNAMIHCQAANVMPIAHWSWIKAWMLIYGSIPLGPHMEYFTKGAEGIRTATLNDLYLFYRRRLASGVDREWTRTAAHDCYGLTRHDGISQAAGTYIYTERTRLQAHIVLDKKRLDPASEYPLHNINVRRSRHIPDRNATELEKLRGRYHVMFTPDLDTQCGVPLEWYAAMYMAVSDVLLRRHCINPVLDGLYVHEDRNLELEHIWLDLDDDDDSSYELPIDYVESIGMALIATHARHEYCVDDLYTYIDRLFEVDNRDTLEERRQRRKEALDTLCTKLQGGSDTVRIDFNPAGRGWTMSIFELYADFIKQSPLRSQMNVRRFLVRDAPSSVCSRSRWDDLVDRPDPPTFFSHSDNRSWRYWHLQQRYSPDQRVMRIPEIVHLFGDQRVDFNLRPDLFFRLCAELHSFMMITPRLRRQEFAIDLHSGEFDSMSPFRVHSGEFRLHRQLFRLTQRLNIGFKRLTARVDTLSKIYARPGHPRGVHEEIRRNMNDVYDAYESMFVQDIDVDETMLVIRTLFQMAKNVMAGHLRQWPTSDGLVLMYHICMQFAKDLEDANVDVGLSAIVDHPSADTRYIAADVLKQYFDDAVRALLMQLAKLQRDKQQVPYVMTPISDDDEKIMSVAETYEHILTTAMAQGKNANRVEDLNYMINKLRDADASENLLKGIGIRRLYIRLFQLYWDIFLPERRRYERLVTNLDATDSNVPNDHRISVRMQHGELMRRPITKYDGELISMLMAYMTQRQGQRSTYWLLSSYFFEGSSFLDIASQFQSRTIADIYASALIRTSPDAHDASLLVRYHTIMVDRSETQQLALREWQQTRQTGGYVPRVPRSRRFEDESAMDTSHGGNVKNDAEYHKKKKKNHNGYRRLVALTKNVFIM